ncbi:calcium uniporter protein, mitochondrial isoform X1 [Hippocampus comes]|uniref:Calcium uniporter protein n=1 Tax=Hippocampus comes TaxID=109280 RepID=A0A3Q2YXE8_HIPCM|nr:PREDICTED: calcium uniporter protein, mitochondrial isoform X1 [Hippocampus comes]
MAAKVCRSVLLLSRSGGAAIGSLPALVPPSPRHQQHIRPQEILSAPFTRQTVRRAHGLRSAAHSTLFTQPTTALSPQIWRGSPSWHGQRMLCTPASSEEVTVVYQNGLPVISVSLPSRRERCQFTLKPLSDCVGVFLQQLQAEDRGIDRVAIYSTDGARVASSTGIDILLLDDFKLVINDTAHLVRPPRRELLPHEETERLNDVKFLVQQLYTTLRIEEHQLSKERELIERLEDLNSQLRPLEKVKQELSRKAERRTTWVLWGGMAYMATQFGILARLTWWEYSWDIMEPVTYFITYGTAMAMYAYFVLTRQEYVYPDARDRQYLLFLHKGVKRTRFDIEKYNKLKEDISEVELDLKRLRDPLQLQLPVQQLNSGKD